MVTLTNADKILKSVYLDVISNQLNNCTNAFYNMIDKGAEQISGKEIIAVSRYGINGGVGSASETGTLPMSSGNNYINFKAELKNIYGTIELSDKSLRASQNSGGALVNILNEEIEGLLDSAKFNFNRMLFQNGNGVLAKLLAVGNNPSLVNLPINSTKNVVEGMVIDIMNGNTVVSSGHRIVKVDREGKIIVLSPAIASGTTLADGYCICLQQSYNQEIFGLSYLFDNTISSLYGNSRNIVSYILPTTRAFSSGLTLDGVQEMLDTIDEKSGNNINLIISSYDMRRDYLSLLTATRTNIDYFNLDGGFKALSYNGMPLVAERFAPDKTMYFLNTADFKLAELCDWQWIEGENGNVLSQLEKKPAYTATLAKYANLICVRPSGQGMLTIS